MLACDRCHREAAQDQKDPNVPYRVGSVSVELRGAEKLATGLTSGPGKLPLADLCSFCVQELHALLAKFLAEKVKK